MLVQEFLLQVSERSSCLRAFSLHTLAVVSHKRGGPEPPPDHPEDIAQAEELDHPTKRQRPSIDGEDELGRHPDAEPALDVKKLSGKVTPGEQLKTRCRLFNNVVLDIDARSAAQVVFADRGSLSYLCGIYRVQNEAKYQKDFQNKISERLPEDERRQFLEALDLKGKRRAIRNSIQLAPEEAPKLTEFLEHSITGQLKGISERCRAHNGLPDPTGEMIHLATANDVVDDIHKAFLDEMDETWNLRTRGLAVGMMDLACKVIKSHIAHRRKAAQKAMPPPPMHRAPGLSLKEDRPAPPTSQMPRYQHHGDSDSE